MNRTRLGARLARSNMEASADRLRAEPGTRREQVNLLTAMLANCHRFVRATMVLEVPAGAEPVREEFRSFANDVEKTLELLARMLRGEKVIIRQLPGAATRSTCSCPSRL